MTLGHLKAHAFALIKLKYIIELPIEGKATKLTIPTTIAPRYIPPSDDSYAAKEIAKIGYKNSFDPKTPLDIFINVHMKGQIKRIRSPSHPDFVFKIKDGPIDGSQCHATAKLEKSTTGVMGKDVIVFFDVEDNDQPRVFVEKSDDGSAVMMSLVPSFKLDDQKTELIFLVDRSGSMGRGSIMTMVKKALSLFLHSLPPDCRFNIVSFGSRFTHLFEKKSAEYNDRSLKKAKVHVENMTADYGGTQVYGPLKCILAQKPIVGYARQIFLLTDGDVSNAEQVIRLVKRHNDSSRVFALGLGDLASRHLVKGVARAGNGTSLFANLNEDLRPKVIALLKNANAPSLTDIKVLWNGTDKKDTKNKIRKAKPKDQVRTLLGVKKTLFQDDEIASNDNKSKVLFDGTRMLNFKLFNDKDIMPETVVVVAQAPHGPLRFTIPISEDDVLSGGRFVHQMAARRKIQEIVETVPLMPYEYGYDVARAESAKAFITHLGLKFGLATKYTSFIGVDEKSKKTMFECVMQKRHIEQHHDHIMMWDSSTIHIDGGSSLWENDGICSDLEDDGMSAFMDSDNEVCGASSTAVTSMENEQGATSMTKNNLQDIVEFQLANGSFETDPALLKLMFLDEQSLKDYCPDGTELDVWMTAVCYAFIETTFESEKQVMSLAMEKTRKYLTSACENLEYVLECAMTLKYMSQIALTAY